MYLKDNKHFVEIKDEKVIDDVYHIIFDDVSAIMSEVENAIRKLEEDNQD